MDSFDRKSMLTALCIAGIAAILVLRPRRRLVPEHDPTESAVLITGGNRGIGRSTADYLSNRGYTVLVTVRKQAKFDELEKAKDVLHPVILDVTDDSHVDPAVQRVKEVLAEQKVSLVAIVNNAGINPEIEMRFDRMKAGDKPDNSLADLSIASRVFDTNVIGVVRVTRAFLPLLATGGRVINIGSYFGSMAGKTGLSHAYYEASKFALEGLSDNMRRSLRQKWIKVSLVKPGNIATDMNAAGEVGADVVAENIEHAIGASNPHPRYYPGTVRGLPTRIVCWAFEMLPTWLADML